MSRYDYKELVDSVLNDASTENVNNLAEWLERYGNRWWNGFCFDTSKDLNGLNVYPVYKEIDEDEYEVVGYQLSSRFEESFFEE